jgi:4-aminobutyrate aminotransferase/diaminobutyrate-pyruvate transaminase/4-aminobutyrate aminotransferase/(S)-3-amino-2-methylpropionate transaminase
MPDFDLTPRPVPRVETQHRRIVTPIPVPESVPILERLYAVEPVAMQGQPPVLWDRADGMYVYDRWGNRWLDWSSGVLVTNAGHGRAEIIDAIRVQAEHGLLTNYCFPSEIRARLVEKLASLLPAPLKKVFLLTTGSETVECAVKLCRTHGLQTAGRHKITVVSFQNAFHGRTLGSQQAGGIPGLKSWIVNLDPDFVQLPFPDGYRCRDTSFGHFERGLEGQGVSPDRVAGVILETYQGGDAAFAPPEFMQALRRWCDHHGALLVCDEVQAGFGRTGTLWGFEHYGIVPDLACFGKGITSCLPLSAVAGRPDVMDLHPKGSMTSTHTGNPICCAAALANIDVIVKERLWENAARVGGAMHAALRALMPDFPQVGTVLGKGLVAGVPLVDPETRQPDSPLAYDTVRRCYEKGLLMFNPVGLGGATVKIAPPLVTTEEAALEGVGVLREALAEAVAERQKIPAEVAAR